MNIPKLFLGLALLPIVCAATEVKKINDDWYLAEKTFQFTDEKGETVKKPYYFSMERVKTEEQKEALKKFVGEQERIACHLEKEVQTSRKYWDKFSFHFDAQKKPEKDANEKRLDYLYKNMGVIGIYGSTAAPSAMLSDCLDRYDQCDVWIAYVADQKPLQPLAETCRTEDGIRAALNTIQMMVSVSTHQKKVPFQMHMGIFANPVIVRDQKNRPKKLSIELHGFGAAASLARYGSSKIYMITAPWKKMRKILQENLGEDCIVGVRAESMQPGDNRNSPVYVVRNCQRLEFFRLYSPDRTKVIFETKWPASAPGWFLAACGLSENNDLYVTIELAKLAKKF